MLCRKCKHNHVGADESPENVCTEISCMCTSFQQATPENPTINDYQKYLEHIEKVRDKVKYILENIPELRDSSNKEFVFNYWFLCDGLKEKLDSGTIDKLTDPEVIRRSKQKLAELEPLKYGATKEKVQVEKSSKYWGIMEFVINQ